MKKIFPLLAMLLIVCACNDDKFIEPFVNSDELRLVQKGKTLFTYNPNTCQISFNREKRQFRVQTDDMQDFYMLTLSAMPTSEGQELTGTLMWTTRDEVNAIKNVAFSVKKVEGDKIWLWTRNGKIGVVVRVLD
jgi:hypothetical protein